MEAVGLATALLAIFSLLASQPETGVKPSESPPAQQQEPPGPPAEPAAEAQGSIAMAEVTLDSSTVRGRVLSETDDTIKLETFGSGVIGYRKSSVSSIRHLTLTPVAYYEEVGDFHHRRAWQVEEGATEFVQARQAYVTAQDQSTTAQERDRIRAKLDLLSQDREEWQKEALRKAALRKAEQEVELAKVQKDIAKEQLAGLHQQDQKIRELQVAVRDLQDQATRISVVIDQLGIRMDDLKDNVDRLGRLDRVFVTQNVFLDLQRAQQDLKRDVDRLQRQVEK
jgi:hypothetical protein